MLLFYFVKIFNVSACCSVRYLGRSPRLSCQIGVAHCTLVTEYKSIRHYRHDELPLVFFIVHVDEQFAVHVVWGSFVGRLPFPAASITGFSGLRPAGSLGFKDVCGSMLLITISGWREPCVLAF